MNLAATVAAHRRALHCIPELGFELPKTLAYIESQLEKLPCTLLRPAPSSLCAFFDAGRPDTLAFRADMDALPVAEQNKTEYASCHAGKMHACGHDGHMAMLLTFAELLAKTPQLLSKHNALLVFQPAEETTGGAKAICDSGIFQKVNTTAVFGIHLQPQLAAGKLATRPGPLMAQAVETDLHFTGKSAHVARASEGADAAYAAALFLCGAYQMEKEELPAEEKRILRYGLAQAGTVRNALAAEASLFGTYRCLSQKTADFLEKRIREIAQQAAQDTGCQVAFRFGAAYPPMDNDPDLYQKVIKALGEKLGILEAEIEMTGEDFSFYGQVAPSLFFRLGIGEAPALHAADFDFDEKALESGCRLYTELMGI